jgi:serine protease Do
MRNLTFSILCLAVLLGACSDGENARSAEPAAADTSTLHEPGSLPNFAPLVATYGKAVVNVEVVQNSSSAAAGRESMPDDPFFDFFRRFGMPAPGTPPQRYTPQQAPRGAGSGFIITPDGYILTNAHVVADAQDVTVRLTDRREFQAKVIGADSRTDVAVVKIDAANLPTTRIGDPSRLQTGEWVLAIGSPFGLENSATAGIVSATSRSVGGDSSLPFIQTDVAVNPGNSGGPLFNMQGEVVGINSMIFSSSGGYMGLSFAIPIDVATDVRDQLIKTGRVAHGRIGVRVQDVTARLAEAFGLDRPRGALVSAVEEGGAAEKAGIRAGDVILRVSERDIERSGELAAVVTRLRPGAEAKLLVWRDKQQHEFTVRVGEIEQQSARAAPAARAAPVGGSEDATGLGLRVRPLSPEEKGQLDTAGELVIERASGAAAAAGAQPGDIILGVNGRPVGSVKELRASVKEAGNNVALLLQRGDDQLFIPVRGKGS